MSTLTAEFSAAFSRDLKKKAKRRKWDLSELQKLIDLVLQNTPESMDILKRRHNMHRLPVRSKKATSSFDDHMTSQSPEFAT